MYHVVHLLPVHLQSPFEANSRCYCGDCGGGGYNDGDISDLKSINEMKGKEVLVSGFKMKPTKMRKVK